MKLVFVTQELDVDHAALEQSLDLVRGLASRVDELAIVARDVRWDKVPSNARVRTFEARGKLGRGVRFERALHSSLGDADAVLVHMVPQFAVLAAPAVRARRLPLALWYTHWQASRSLRVATRLVDVVLSVDRASFPFATPKLRGIGHAIDVERFAAAPPSPHPGPLRLLALGRTARWKGLGTLLDALALAVESGTDATLEIRGPSLNADERAHREELAAGSPATSGCNRGSSCWSRSPGARSRLSSPRSTSLVSPNEPRSRVDPRQGGVRGRCLRASGRLDERRLRAAARRAASPAARSARRSGCAGRCAARRRRGRRRAARGRRGRAAASGGRAPLARPLGGRR